MTANILKRFKERKDDILLLSASHSEASGKVSKVIALIENLKDSYSLEQHKTMEF